MKFHLQQIHGQNVIRAYADGRVTVNEHTYERSLLVTPAQLVADWGPPAFAALTPAHFEAIARLEPEVVVLGTGTRLHFPAPELCAALTAAQIGLEVMDLGAACRTYNILLGEGRRVAAALIIERGDGGGA